MLLGPEFDWPRWLEEACPWHHFHGVQTLRHLWCRWYSRKVSKISVGNETGVLSYVTVSVVTPFDVVWVTVIVAGLVVDIVALVVLEVVSASWTR